jgi:dTDP-4-amino-4,6-dideoxygalactose transaminase
VHGVDEARSRIHTNARRLGDPTPGVCHAHGGLLIARVEDAEILVRHNVERRQDVVTGQAENIAHTFVLERLANQLTSGNSSHDRLLIARVGQACHRIIRRTMRMDQGERMKEEYVGSSSVRAVALFSSVRFRRAFFPLVPLAVPCWNGASYRAIIQSIATGRIIEGSELGKLRESIIETLGVTDAVLYGSGSLALEIALRVCGVAPRDDVVIPTFCCTAVVQPILAVGAVPVLADVGVGLNLTAETVDAALTKKTKAIIVPHLFGNPADIRAIIELARGRNIRVIDDAAQALGATIDGQPAGSFGDVGILSFGKEKVCSGLGGGVLVSRSEEFQSRIANIDLSVSRRVKALGSCMSTLVWHRWRRWTLPLQRVVIRSARAGPDSPPATYRKETMANLNAAVALSLIRTLAENIAARRARVQCYHELLGGDESLSLVSHPAGSACLTQVIRVSARRRGVDLATRVIQTLAQEGYEVQGSYVPIHLLPGYEQCMWDRLPHAERIWSNLIELPCEPAVGLDHVERIAAIVKCALRS